MQMMWMWMWTLIVDMVMDLDESQKPKMMWRRKVESGSPSSPSTARLGRLEVPNRVRQDVLEQLGHPRA